MTTDPYALGTTADGYTVRKTRGGYSIVGPGCEVLAKNLPHERAVEVELERLRARDGVPDPDPEWPLSTDGLPDGYTIAGPVKSWFRLHYGDDEPNETNVLKRDRDRDVLVRAAAKHARGSEVVVERPDGDDDADGDDTGSDDAPGSDDLDGAVDDGTSTSTTETAPTASAEA